MRFSRGPFWAVTVIPLVMGTLLFTAAGAAVAPGLVQGAMDSYRGKSATQRHDLYYLYELDRRTQHS